MKHHSSPEPPPEESQQKVHSTKPAQSTMQHAAQPGMRLLKLASQQVLELETLVTVLAVMCDGAGYTEVTEHVPAEYPSFLKSCHNKNAESARG